jgi:hypothetical protein
MQLKYHQATYKLLTQDFIDPQPAIDLFEKYEAPHVFEINKQKIGDAAAHKKVAEWREYLLGWTGLNLHNRHANFSSENIDSLDNLEKQYSVKLPQSVREWYSLDIAPEIMSVHGNGYPPLYEPIEKIGPLSERDFAWRFSPRDDLWYFLISEYIDQGGQEILFQVGTTDDPPVFALHGDEYIELASKFSEFIYRHFWVWHARYVFRYNFFIYNYHVITGFQ